MEQLNIKDYLQINNIAVDKKKKQPTEYSFSLVFDNGSDFVIERNTKNNIKRQLCFIANENLLFIRDPKSNSDRKITTERQIKDFLVYEDTIKDLEFKNKFFSKQETSDFSYNVLKIHKEGLQLRRDLVRHGLNPLDYVTVGRWSGDSELRALDEIDFQKVLKIIRIVQDFEDKLKKKKSNYKNQICAEFILFLCRLQDKYSIDYVRIFLEIYSNYDAFFMPSMSDYEHYNHTGKWRCPTFERPLDEFNLDFRRYCEYLFRDLYSQGIPDIDGKLLEGYYDCLAIQLEIYGKVKDKYPEHFKEMHDKVVLIYNLNQEYFKERKIEALNNYNKKLEYSDGEYAIIVAKTSEDLISEGINLHHCVGSYVGRVQNGDCSIFFLRKANDLETSLITIEVRENKVIQVRGLCERLMDDNERKFFNKWVNEKNLAFVGE